ncbi:hypothetical protein IAD21_02096 [Abditibacteriota bacterium]|nr:hypothetical protein IAD21_02096 [Abditibacteriota bacterium]
MQQALEAAQDTFAMSAARHMSAHTREMAMAPLSQGKTKSRQRQHLIQMSGGQQMLEVSAPTMHNLFGSHDGGQREWGYLGFGTRHDSRQDPSRSSARLCHPLSLGKEGSRASGFTKGPLGHWGSGK